MKPIMRAHAWVSFLMFLLCTPPACRAQESLSEMLQLKKIGVNGILPEDLSKQISGMSESDTADCHWLTTYVWDKTKAGVSALSAYFYAFRQDKKSGSWTTARLTWPELKISETPGAIALRVDACNAGSITGINQVGAFVFFNGHINPSAGCTMVVTRDLKFYDTFWGWMVGQFKDGRILYQHSEVHWAPTHFVELSIYDPERKTKRAIYPLKPYQKVRSAYMTQVKAVYDACCPKIMPGKSIVYPGGNCSQRFGNHHCNPEFFDNYLKGSVAVNSDSDALAFATVFDDETREHPEVIYIYRNVSSSSKMDYREFLAGDLAARYGNRSLEDYLQPKFLSELFASPAVK